MSGRARKRPVAGLRLAAAATAVLLLLGPVTAHSFLVLGELRSSPNPPRPGEPAALTVALEDQRGAPVEDAVLRAEITPPGGGEAVTLRFEEAETGLYEASFAPSGAGTHSVLLRDLTFRDEVVEQTVELPVGGEAFAPIPFLFPPSHDDPGPRVWLLWLVGVPLLAGAVVTLLVLRSGGDAEAGEE